MKRVSPHLILLAIVLATSMDVAGGPLDTGIRVQYGGVPIVQGFAGVNGHAVVAARQTASSHIHGDFSSAFRGDLLATSGGEYGDLNPGRAQRQSAYVPFNAQMTMATQGQAIGFFGYENGLGKGNAMFGDGLATCYGGGEVAHPNSSPECAADGEYEAGQGTLVFAALITGSPLAAATTIHYASATNESVLGARTVFNADRAVHSKGSISNFTLCAEGSAVFGPAPCPAHCPEGAGSYCSVVRFDGAALPSSTPSGWYFKTGSQTDNYAPAGVCAGDDVPLSNGGAGRCVGHWYRVSSIDSADQLTLYAPFDTFDLGQYLGTSQYLLTQGLEATAVDTTSKTVSFESNSVHWTDGEHIYSPPSHLMMLIGLNLNLRKQFIDGIGQVSGSVGMGIRDVNYGPALMDYGIYVAGAGIGRGQGGFRTGIGIANLNPRTSGPGGVMLNNTRAIDVQSDVNYVLTAPAGSVGAGVSRNVIALGSAQEDQQWFDGTTHSHEFRGVPVQFGTGLYNDGAGLKHIRSTFTASFNPSSIIDVTISWASPFADANYTPICSTNDPSGYIQVVTVMSYSAATLRVRLLNTDKQTVRGAAPYSVNCYALHD